MKFLDLVRVKKMDSHFNNAQNDLNDILITTNKISNKKNKLLKLDLELVFHFRSRIKA